MTRSILVTDTHAGARNDNEAIARYQDRIWKSVFDYADENGINVMFHGGDFFDKRQHTTHKTLFNLKNGFLRMLDESNVKEFHIIVGNHDVAYRNTNEVNSPEMLLESHPKIKVHTTPKVVGNLLLMPWLNAQNYQEFMGKSHTHGVPYMLGHFEINGFDMHKGCPAEGGMEPTEFAAFDKVFSGHFHTRSTKGNITYLGSLFEMNWSDWDDPRGFHVFDDETGSLQFQSNIERMFYKVDWEDGPSITTPYNDSFLEDCKEKFVKVNVK